jgi:hypothetical protein
METLPEIRVLPPAVKILRNGRGRVDPDRQCGEASGGIGTVARRSRRRGEDLAGRRANRSKSTKSRGRGSRDPRPSLWEPPDYNDRCFAGSAEPHCLRCALPPMDLFKASRIPKQERTERQNSSRQQQVSELVRGWLIVCKAGDGRGGQKRRSNQRQARRPDGSTTRRRSARKDPASLGCDKADQRPEREKNCQTVQILRLRGESFQSRRHAQKRDHRSRQGKASDAEVDQADCSSHGIPHGQGEESCWWNFSTRSPYAVIVVHDPQLYFVANDATGRDGSISPADWRFPRCLPIA